MDYVCIVGEMAVYVLYSRNGGGLWIIFVFCLYCRKNGSNKCIKILSHRGKFGFTDPCEFSSVVELVEYYQQHSLNKHNKALDIKLLYPFSRSENSVSISQCKTFLKFEELLVQTCHSLRAKLFKYLNDYSKCKCGFFPPLQLNIINLFKHYEHGKNNKKSTQSLTVNKQYLSLLPCKYIKMTNIYDVNIFLV